MLCNLLNQPYLCFQTYIQLNMALRRSQWSVKKSGDELELIVPESEAMIIGIEEVEIPEKSENDKERQPSQNKKTIGPNIGKQQKQ